MSNMHEAHVHQANSSQILCDVQLTLREKKD